MHDASPGVQPHRGNAASLDDARALYRHMARLRIVSARLVELQREGAVAYHAASIGEEAVICAAALAARENDWVFPGGREWGAGLVRGVPLATCFGQAFGHGAAPAKGHAVPDETSARAHRVGPTSGVVGAHVPQAVGFAWAARAKKEDLVTLALFGEGASATGDFHNAMNFAGVFKAPCVLVCRADGRALPRAQGFVDAASRAAAYGVASAEVDGADALAVLAVLREAVARAAAGRGATFVEARTSPLAPELGEGAWARPALLDLGAGDPLAQVRGVLDRAGSFDQASEAAWLEATRVEVEAAVANAKATPAPPPSAMFENVFAEVPELLARQKEAPWAR